MQLKIYAFIYKISPNDSSAEDFHVVIIYYLNQIFILFTRAIDNGVIRVLIILFLVRA